MQTERVTFLTTPDHKAALDAFATASGHSVGHVVREATSRFIADGEVEEEAELALLVHALNDAIPRMRSDIREAVAAIDASNWVVDEVLARLERQA